MGDSSEMNTDKGLLAIKKIQTIPVFVEFQSIITNRPEAITINGFFAD